MIGAAGAASGGTRSKATRASLQTGPSFSGNGGRALPPFTVRAPSTLVWASSGDIFQIFASGLGGGDVNSSAHRGWTYLPPGRYQLQVNAIGNWAIKVASGVIAPSRMGSGLVGYRGSGSQDLPPFTTRHGRNLSWTSGGDLFQIFGKEFNGGGDVNSEAHRGTSYLNAGKHTLTINTTGPWTIAWHP